MKRRTLILLSLIVAISLGIAHTTIATSPAFTFDDPIELVTNGEFGSDTEGWEFAQSGRDCGGGYKLTHDGENGALISGDEYKLTTGCRSYLHQTITIPEDAEKGVLSFKVAATSGGCGSTTANAVVGLKTEAGIESSNEETRPFDHIIEGGFAERNECASNFISYRANIDLSTYTGSDITIYGVSGDAWERDHNQKAWFKDISLTYAPGLLGSSGPVTTVTTHEPIKQSTTTIPTYTTYTYPTTTSTHQVTTTTQPTEILDIIKSLILPEPTTTTTRPIPTPIPTIFSNPIDAIFGGILKQICLFQAQWEGRLSNC